MMKVSAIFHGKHELRSTGWSDDLVLIVAIVAGLVIGMTVGSVIGQTVNRDALFMYIGMLIGPVVGMAAAFLFRYYHHTSLPRGPFSRND